MEKALSHGRNVKGAVEDRKQESKIDKSSPLRGQWEETTFDFFSVALKFMQSTWRKGS